MTNEAAYETGGESPSNETFYVGSCGFSSVSLVIAGQGGNPPLLCSFEWSWEVNYFFVALS